MNRILAALLSLLLSTIALAAPVPRSAGNYVETSRIVVSSFTPTVIITSDPWDDDCDIMNNSAFTLYIGTNTSTLLTTGFPILSSNTYTLDGNFTGTLYGLVDSGSSGNQNARIIRYKRNAQ